MRKILIIIGLLIGLAGYGQTVVNKQVMLDSLQNKIAVKDTAAMLTRYINKADTAAMLNPYALLSEMSTTALDLRIDSIVAVLGDTLNIETLLNINLTTDTVADLSELRLKSKDRKSVV